jgi:MFS family permease
LRHNRNFRLLWLGQAISILGDYVFDTTMVLWVGTVLAAGQPWAPLAVSGVLISVLAPALLIGPFAGVFVDRWDRRRTMLLADLVRAVLVGGLVVLVLLPAGSGTSPVSVSGQLVVVYALVGLASVAAQFFNPARFALLGAVVAGPDQPRAASLGQATASFAGIVGPPLAAPLLFTAGVEWALVVNAVSFLASYLAVRAIRVPAATSAPGGPATGVLTEFREGLRFFAGNRVLVAVVGAAVLVMAGAGAVNALDVFFVVENLGVAPSFYGLLGAAFDIGAVAGALLAAAYAARIGINRTFWLGLVLAGLAFVAYSRTTDLIVAMVVLALTGAPIAAVNSAVGPIALRETPQHLLGRVMSVFSPVVQLASIGSIAVASALASTVLHDLDTTVLGTRFRTFDTIFLVSGLFIVAGGLWARRALGGRPPADRPSEVAVG